MAKKERGPVRKLLLSFVNFPQWMGARSLKASAQDIKTMAKQLFVPKQATRFETFDEAVARMNLSEDDLVERRRQFAQMAVLYLLLTLGLFGYTLYLIFYGTMSAVLMTAVLTLVGFSFFFKEHFWYTQLKYRRLGFTFKEWLTALFKELP